MKSEISAPLQQTVKDIDMKYFLLETDGPYVKPQKPDEITSKKWTKARNSSLILPAIAKRIAEIKGVSLDEVLSITEENTKRVFNLKKCVHNK